MEVVKITHRLLRSTTCTGGRKRRYCCGVCKVYGWKLANTFMVIELRETWNKKCDWWVRGLLCPGKACGSDGVAPRCPYQTRTREGWCEKLFLILIFEYNNFIRLNRLILEETINNFCIYTEKNKWSQGKRLWPSQLPFILTLVPPALPSWDCAGKMDDARAATAADEGTQWRYRCLESPPLTAHQENTCWVQFL